MSSQFRRFGEGRPDTRERRKPSLPYREIANVTIFSVLLSSYAIISFDSVPFQGGREQIKLFLSFILFFPSTTFRLFPLSVPRRENQEKQDFFELALNLS